jgi:hypothetical protein
MEQALEQVFNSHNCLSGSGVRELIVVNTFSRNHRTLQQMFVRSVILPILEYLAKSYEQGAYDLRNEASCRLASRMLAAVKEEDRYLPLI